MKISVIIPTYNRSKFILKAIQSVINQTIQVDEIIVVDDGSIDSTKELLQNLPIKYIYQENSGVSSARNKGIKYAKNQWIAFLDSDDIWEQNKIEQQMKFHKQNQNILFSYTDELWKFNNKIIKQNKSQEKKQNSIFVDNISLCKIGASTVLINKIIFEDVGCFDENLIACEDYDLWLRILRKYEVGYIPNKLITKIAGHNGQLSFDIKAQDYYRILALEKHLSSEYQDEIKQEIMKKVIILQKGALKHKNQFFIDFCANFISPK